MKKLNFYFVVFFCSLIASSGIAIAQTEIVVDEGYNTLIVALNENPGETLILKRGGSYVIDQSAEITVATMIKGETTPVDTAPAVVSFFADPGAVDMNALFLVGADFIIKDVGLIGFTFDEQKIGPLLQVSAKDINITMDGCVVQNAYQILETNGNDSLTIVQKNCKFMNLVNDGFDNWGGYGCMWGGDNSTFTSTNNTFFLCGRIFNCAAIGPNATATMDHNTYVNTWGETYYPSFAEGFVVKNNLQYNPFIRGYVGPRSTPEEYAGDFTGDFAADSLQGDICIFPMEVDTLGGARNVVVTNNMSFTNDKVLTKQAEATATMMPYINETMRSYFDEYNWTLEDNLTMEDGNAVDPQFEMGEIPDDAYTMMFNQLIQRRRVSLQEDGYPFACGWWPNGVTKGEFIWPLPFNFRPTNAAVLNKAENGYPLGDLNWFGSEMVANWENGLINGVSFEKNEVSAQTAYIANDILKFKGFDKPVNVEIYTIVGRKVFSAKTVNEVNVSGLSRGIYLVKVDGIKEAFKVIK